MVIPFDAHRARTYLHGLRGRAHRFAWAYYRWRVGKGRRPSSKAHLPGHTESMIRGAIDVALGRSRGVVAPARFAGWQERPGGKPPIALYQLTKGIPGHPKGSHVSAQTLEGAGFELPSTPAKDNGLIWGRTFRHERLASTRGLDKRSIRTTRRGRHRIVTGCPRGYYDGTRCRVGTVAVAVLHPKHENPCELRAVARRSSHNPPRGARASGGARLLYPAGRIVGTWYGRHRNGQLYKHRFGRGLKSIHTLPDGSLILSAHRGRLWQTFG